MLYTVQNAGGEVYGGWPLPDEPGYTAEEWASKLHERLADIEGPNGITASPLLMGLQTKEKVDRVAVDIEPWHYTRRVATLDESARLERVHIAVGMIARGEVPESPIDPHVSRISSLLAKTTRRSR
jgi:hypothetical protein